MSYPFYKVGGTLPIDSDSYVTRKEDNDLCDFLEKGEYCYVFNSRQMGKSSIKDKTQKKLTEKGIIGIDIDLQGIGTNLSQKEWYGSFIYNLLTAVSLENNLDLGTWLESRLHLSPTKWLNDFIAYELLTFIQEKIVIFIDEIDCIFDLPFRDDFFSLIRFFYNQRNRNQDYKRLTFCLLGVATPSDLIQNPAQSPFNIGRAVELKGFEFDESLVLAEGLQEVASNPQNVLRSILSWTGGQPFLTQKVCSLLANSEVRVAEGKEKLTIAQFVRSRVIENWENNDDPVHFRTILNRLLEKEELKGKLLEIYRSILKEGSFCSEGDLFEAELRLSGLVVKRKGKLQVFNPIYEEIFNETWVQKQLDSLRPYYYSFNNWLASGKDDIYLLSEKSLTQAEIWREGKNLSKEDEEYLRNSKLQQVSREFSNKLEAENEAKNILKQANQKARRLLVTSIIISSFIVIATLVFASVQTINQRKATQAARKAQEKLQQTQNERNKIVKNIEKANSELDKVNKERYLVEKQVKATEQKLTKTQDKLIKTEEEKKELEKERQFILAEKQKAEHETKNTRNSLKKTQSKLQDSQIQLHQTNKDYKQAEKARQGAVLATRFEQQGISLLRRFESGSQTQISLLLESLEVGQELQQMVNRGLLSKSSTPSFLYALHTLSNYVQEKNFFKGLVAHPDHQYIIKNPHEEIAQIWSLDGRLLAELDHGKTTIQSVVFENDIRVIRISPNHQYIATITRAYDRISAYLWNSQGHLIAIIDEDRPSELAFSPDGRYLAIGYGHHFLGGNDQGYSVRLLDLQGNLVREFKAHTDHINAMEFSPDGKYLATGSLYKDETARLWDLEGNLLAEFNHQDNVITVAFNAQGYLITRSSEGIQRIWMTKRKPFQEFQANEFIRDLKFSPNGQYIATGMNNKAALWDLQGNLLAEFLHQYGGIEYDVNSVAFSPDGQYIATASEDQTARLWNLQGHLLTEFRGHGDFDKSSYAEIYKPYDVDSVIFSPDGEYLVTISDDNTARLWDLQGNLVRTLIDQSNLHSAGFQTNLHSIAFSPDGKYIVTGSSDDTTGLWDFQGNLVIKLKHQSDVVSVAFSPYGKYIVTGSRDKKARLWDLQGNLLTEFKFDYQDNARSLKFSPNGKYLVAGSRDKKARLWDLQGNLLAEFKGHEKGVSNVAFSPNGKYLATGSSKTIRLWSIYELDELLAQGCNWLNDYFISHPEDLEKLPICQNMSKRPE